jgi:oligopeptide/dipeptide ABC transporter ATP-binding protein
VRSLLEVSNLRTEFATRAGVVRAVDDVSFSVGAGETVALVGESGCGKSVTALSVMRLVPKPAGRIAGGVVRFRDRDLLALPEAEMRAVRGREIAMIFQEPMTSLNPTLTIGRQLTEGPEVHLGLEPTAARAHAVELLTQVGISDPDRRLRDYPHQWSGGMRQRLMIAMALACRPALVLADEPTTALDVTIQAQILELLRELTRRMGVALLLITHNLGVVARYADRVNVMYAGRIVERAAARALYATPRHPYTAGLLRSVPRLDEARRPRLAALEGRAPDLAQPAPGCAFAPRCAFRVARCTLERPALEPVGADDHHAACWQTSELARAPVE